MVSQKKPNAVRKIDTAKEGSRPPTSPTFPNITNDELIVTLSNARENRRARQVAEWECSQRQNIRPLI